MDEYFDNLSRIAEQIEVLRRAAGAGDTIPSPILDQALAYLDTVVEEQRITQAEVDRQTEELEAARRALEDERLRYQELFQFAPDAYLVTDMYGIIQETNHAAVQLFQRSQRYLIGKPLAGRLDARDRRPFRSYLVHADEYRGLPERELRLENGTYVAAAVSLQRSREGRPIALRWLLRDVTRRQEILRQSEERFRLTLESLTDYAIFMTDSCGVVIQWSPGAGHILGYLPIEIVGRNISRLYAPEEVAKGAPQRMLDQAAREGHADLESWLVRKDGTRFWGSGITRALHEERSPGFVTVVRDTTAQRQMAMERAQELARIAEQEQQAAVLTERNRIAQEIHDTLAQGFAGITLQLEAAEDCLCGAPEQAHYHITRARQLARESLAEARRSVQALRPQALQDQTLPDALNRLSRQTTADTGIAVGLRVCGDPRALPADVDAALLRIGQEAVTNAVRHAEPRRIEIELFFEPQEVRLIVQDDGRGFDPRMLPPGVGFGLGIMRERTERIGGRWSVHSPPGLGAIVRVIVPIPI